MVRSSGFVPDPSWGGGGGRGAGAGGYGTRSVGGPWAAAAVERMHGRWRRWNACMGGGGEVTESA
jgi:hypothetical protein